MVNFICYYPAEIGVNYMIPLRIKHLNPIKTVFVLLLFLTIPVINLFAQEQKITLKLEEGHEYVFEKVDKDYAIREDDSKLFYSVKTREIRLVVEKFTPGENIILTLRHIKNVHDGVQGGQILNRTDHIFPNFKEGETGYHDSENFIEPLLCRSELKFSIDLNTNEIVLLNRDELIEQFHKRLIEQQYDLQIVEEYLSAVRKREFLVDEDLISFLTWFNNSVIGNDSMIKNSMLEGKLIVKDISNNFINFGDQEFDKIIPGKRLKKFRIDLANGLITNYSFIKFDSVRTTFDFLYRNIIREADESGFRLMYTKKIPENSLFISGKIENPLSNRIKINILDDPFDVIMKTTTVLLDENGRFSKSIDFSHEGFVYIENENNNQHNPPATWVFYSEPGDSVHFESTDSELPRETIFSGTRTEEQELIHEIRKKIRLYEDERKTSWSNEIFDGDIRYSIRISDDIKTSVIKKVEKLLQAIQDAEKIIAGYRQKIPERSYKFILNETRSYFYNGIFYHAFLAFRRDFNSTPGISVSEVETTMKIIDNFNFHESYNDYGLHSRRCTYYYFWYHSNKTNKVQYRYYSGNTVTVSREPEMDLHILRMVLTGPPLYREIGKRMIEILENRSSYFSPLMSDDYLRNFALNNLYLMLRRCNDPEIVAEINEILAQQQKLQNENYIPNIDFVDIDSNRVSFKDFLGDKPTVFYFSSDWLGYRYEYDEAGKSIPEVNFVMVVEGNNFKHWQNYTNRAEPVITHLLYPEGEKTLREIFQNQQAHMVFNKKGELVGYAKSPKEAAKLALDTLNQKKELNIAQLKTIIGILGLLLFLIFLFLILWRWRVRKRFRQEEQKRRLRELELTAIRSQMNPHFLFNCLNSVQNLVQKNMTREAHLYLADFAGLIRKVLQNSEKEEVPLAEEIEMVKQYLNLEQLRFGFDYNISVGKDIDTNNTMVPSMLLQPFAENAVIHGLQTKTGSRELKIEVVRAIAVPGDKHYTVKGSLANKESNTDKPGQDILTDTDDKDRSETASTVIHRNKNEIQGILISIEDNGIGREAAKNLGGAKNGKGSKLLKERLEILSQKQKEKYHLKIIDLKGNGATGTRVEIFIPEEN